MASHIITPTGVSRVRAARFSPEVRTCPSTRFPTRASGVPRSGRYSRVHDRRNQRSNAALRLTRRGRVVAFVGSLVALLALVVAAGQMADATASPDSAVPSSVVVQSGETLWGIAREIAPGHDPRLVIAQIRELNDLGTRSIVPGQTLVVPSLG
jgi:nucleoid-associated protein YgaU